VLVVEERPDELYLGLLELLPAWQNRGLGTDILRWLLALAAGTGRSLTLQVLRANPRAAALYEREGLRVISRDQIRLVMSAEAGARHVR
jgi:GNAT superfamily N-acetyltransferase